MKMYNSIAISPTDFTFASDVSALVIDCIKVLKRVSNIIYAFLLLLVLAIPIILLLILVLYLVKLLEKSYSRDVVLTSANYKEIRAEYIHIDSKMDSLKRASELKDKIKNPVLMVIGAPIFSLVRMTITRRNKIHIALTAINPPKLKNSDFKPVTESDLWNIRPEAYDYVL